jgi:hypothetical protein
MNPVPSAQLRCPGCERVFTPRSLSQHVSWTQDSRCRRVVTTLQSPIVLVAFPCMVSLPALSQNQVVGEDILGNEYGQDNFGVSNETLVLSAHPTEGEFTMTCVAASAIS